MKHFSAFALLCFALLCGLAASSAVQSKTETELKEGEAAGNQVLVEQALESRVVRGTRPGDKVRRRCRQLKDNKKKYRECLKAMRNRKSKQKKGDTNPRDERRCRKKKGKTWDEETKSCIKKRSRSSKNPKNYPKEKCGKACIRCKKKKGGQWKNGRCRKMLERKTQGKSFDRASTVNLE